MKAACNRSILDTHGLDDGVVDRHDPCLILKKMSKLFFYNFVSRRHVHIQIYPNVRFFEDI